MFRIFLRKFLQKFDNLIRFDKFEVLEHQLNKLNLIN